MNYCLKKIFTVLSLLILKNAYSKIILIDPGHGGDDCGAKANIWKKSKSGTKKLEVICEKDLTLSISKKIQKELKKTFKNVYLTRTIDHYVSLESRAAMADKLNADIFISIHVNSSHHSRSHGVETFYLDNHKDAAVKRVEEVENKLEEGKEGVVNQILIDLVIERTAPQSKKLAKYIHTAIHKNVVTKFKMRDRGIKPALFFVLALSKRPAALLEAGFMSNKSDSKKVLNKKFQEEYAKSVASGIRRYFSKKKTPNLF